VLKVYLCKNTIAIWKNNNYGCFFRAKSQTKSLVAQGGGTIQDFDMFALDYDSDRHFSYPSILETDTISLLLIIHL
jgi:hypothetical protein